MKPPAAPSRIYSQPGYVSAFRLGGLACAVLGALSLFLAITNRESPWPGIGLLLAALANFLYADMANDLARTRWRLDLLAHQLQPVIDEAQLAADTREKAEQAAEQARHEEIERLVAARQAKE